MATKNKLMLASVAVLLAGTFLTFLDGTVSLASLLYQMPATPTGTAGVVLLVAGILLWIGSIENLLFANITERREA